MMLITANATSPAIIAEIKIVPMFSDIQLIILSLPGLIVSYFSK